MNALALCTRLLSVGVLAAMTGCAAYRVSSGPTPPAAAQAAALPPAATVLLAEDALPGRRYNEIGPIEVSVKKLTLFHKDPTRDQVNQALTDKARSLGADAVVNIRYEAGIGLTTWGYMDGKGLAVKLQP